MRNVSGKELELKLELTPQELQRHARELGRSVGELRNADILIENIYTPVAGRRQGQPGFGALREALLSQRAAKRAEARAALRGEQWSRLRLYLALWPQTVQDSAHLAARVRVFADAALARGWKKTARRGSDLAALSPEERHEMCKALRGCATRRSSSARSTGLPGSSASSRR